jgi:hypothetical protein
MTETLELGEADGSASGVCGAPVARISAPQTRRVLGDDFRALSIAVLCWSSAPDSPFA